MPLVASDHAGHAVDTAFKEREEEQQCRPWLAQVIKGITKGLIWWAVIAECHV